MFLFTSMTFLLLLLTWDAKLRIAVNKVKFALVRLPHQRFKPKEVHVNTITQFAVPQHVKILKSFLALCYYCAEFIPNFATIAEPLTILVCKSNHGFWLKSNRNLSNIEEFDRRTSGFGLSWLLSTSCSINWCFWSWNRRYLAPKPRGKLRIIRYLCRTLTPAERSNSSPERECVAIVHSVNLLKPYLWRTVSKVLGNCKALRTLKEHFESRLMQVRKRGEFGRHSLSNWFVRFG